MKLSIVIPAIGRQSDIDDTLVSVLENRPKDSEVLLVHPSSYVDPYQLDDEIRLVSSDGSDRLALLNQGFSASTGNAIHTLSPGLIAEHGWCDAALDAFEQNANIGSLSPGMFVGRSKKPVRGLAYQVGRGKQIARKKNQRVICPLADCGFYLRRAVNFMHGFDREFGYLADIDLGLRMLSANYRCVSNLEMPLRCRKKLPAERATGYAAGLARGRLYRRAKRMDLASAGEAWSALIAEPLRHGIGLGIFTGPIGRLASGWSRRSTEVRKLEPTEQATRDRRAA